MTLKHPKTATRHAADLAIAPHFSLETQTIPRHKLPEGEMPAFGGLCFLVGAILLLPESAGHARATSA